MNGLGKGLNRNDVDGWIYYLIESFVNYILANAFSVHLAENKNSVLADMGCFSVFSL